MQVVAARDLETRRGPEDWFTGTVWIDTASFPAPGARVSKVFFEPGARTHWHTHPEGQILYVLAGVGLARREGEGVVEILPGDTVHFPPGEKHWHGAAPDSFMVHLATNPAFETGGETEWLEPVTDEEYGV